MLTRTLLVLLGVFHLVNGLWMLAAPEGWYSAIPGVVQTGPFNHHFILDVGKAFVASGSFFLLGARADASAATFAIAGATWPILHALIHIAGWITGGFPKEPRMILSDVVGVVGLAAIGGLLAWFRSRGETP
jgi:hypothetical protein